MAQVPKAYWNAVRQKFSLSPVWPVGGTVALGDIGRLSPGGWIRETSASGLGMTWDVVRGAPGDYDLSYGADTTIHAGTTADLGAAGGRLEFGSKRGDGLMLKASQGVQADVADLRRLKADVLACPDWDPAWVVVTSVVSVETTCLLIATGRDASATLRLDPGPLLGGLGVTARITAVRKSGTVFSYIAGSPTALLMRCHYVHGNRKRSVKSRDPREDSPAVVPAGRTRFLQLIDLDDTAPLPGAD
ncbi:hypothetical protein [Frankia sp. Cas4]|uniref:hypothetical protein n=1 Tax=Frankia sp. Cas4 TaxID=3073927 RepID=UPI002AD3F982|nr:hypothetical protein [Frankia sp. Cas4]